MAVSLKDKVAIIVGASSGMGAAAARALAEHGMRAVLAARREDRLRELAQTIEESGGTALPCPTDVADRGAVERLVATANDTFGRIDLLVYATGTNIPDRSLDRLTPETWDMMLATNLTGAYHCTQLVLPVMRRQGEGQLIYLSTGAVQTPDVSGVSYQASKHGLSGLAFGTAQEEKANGIRTCVIYPGLTDTEILAKRPVPTPPEVMAKALEPEDVAEAVVYVARLHPRACVPELRLMPAGL